ncbi:MAG TPA: 3'-5' exonuclease, partial [Ktedonobacteraceae bacterium]
MSSFTDANDISIQREDEYLFGWDPMPGIVSVWASREGQALVWRREQGRVVCLRERFSPWVVATSLDDLSHLFQNPQTDRGNDTNTLQLSTPPGPDNFNRSISTVSRDSASIARNGRIRIWYKELDGPVGSYRYLLMSDDGRALERTLVEGAGRRLGHPVGSLNDLTGEYYRVGPVEQYLMLTGRVYFRGLTYNDVHRLQFDLETTALDPHRGRIFMVAIRDSRGFSTVLDAPSAEDEARLIRDLCTIIQERDPDIIENHNIFGFDLPFLEYRASTLNIPLTLGRVGGPTRLERRQERLKIGAEARQHTRYSVAGRELIDTMDAVRRHDFVVRDMPGYSLKEVARYLGVAPPNRVYLEGSKIFDTYRRDPEQVRHYALDDVTEVDGLSQRLQGAPFALAGMAPRRYERLASAGPAMGILEPLLVRSYLHAGTALPHTSTRQDDGNGLHEGGATILFASGIAEQVVKADVASLYPSLMRTFQIGPACDSLSVLLKILGRLTDLRLEHKQA